MSSSRDVIGLEVQRADDPEDDSQDAADEHGEEVVYARAAAAQPVEALDLERDRHQHADERQHVDVLPERRLPLRDGNQFGDQRLEAEEVRQGERGGAEQRVGDDVVGDEQPVVPAHHDGRPAVCLLLV